MKRILVLGLGILISLSACAPETGLEIHDAWARPTPQGENGAVYLVIQNHSLETQEVIGAASDIADAVELHESEMSGDVMQMDPLKSVTLEPGKEIKFEPGGLHIMLVGLKTALTTGDEFEITLKFRDFEDIPVRVSVAEGPMHAEDH